MKKTNILLASLIFFSFVSLIGCSSSNNNLSGSTWKVTKYKTNDGESTKKNISCIITFADSSFRATLDVNDCYGDFRQLNESDVNFGRKNLGCSEACCDEPESIYAATTLMECTFFTKTGGRLLFENESGAKVFLKKAN